MSENLRDLTPLQVVKGCGPKLLEAITKVMAEVPALPKDGYNSHFNYHYTTEGAIMNALRPLMAKHGLVLLLSAFDRTTGSTKTKNSEAVLTDALVTYRLLHVSGEFWDLPIHTTCIDTGDKGDQKCLTQAMKYAIVQTFLLGRGDDPDGGEGAGEGGGRSSAARRREPRPDAQDDRPRGSSNVERDRQKLHAILMVMAGGEEGRAGEILKAITAKGNFSGVELANLQKMQQPQLADAYKRLFEHPELRASADAALAEVERAAKGGVA